MNPRLLVGFVAAAMLAMLPLNAPASATWTTDFNGAVARARAEDRIILLNFTGSDWCGWCVRLKKEVFDTSEFAEYADKNLVLVELDFPRRRKLPQPLAIQNQRLAATLGVRSYPSVFLMRPNGEVFARTGYRQGGPVEYVKHLEETIRSNTDSPASEPIPSDPAASTEPAVEEEPSVRTWTATNGNAVAASFSFMDGNVVTLRDELGRQVRIGLSSLSEPDHDYLRSIEALQ